jgi:hypothetical protein
MTRIEGGTPVDPIRKPPRPGSPMNDLIRERKDHRNRQTEARQEPFFREPEKPDDPDIAALRAQAKADREAADSARRRAEAARART